MINRGVSYSKVYGDPLKRPFESYLKPWKNYESATLKKLQKTLTEKYGDDVLDDPRIKDFFRSTIIEGRTQAHKSLIESIDSPFIERMRSRIRRLWKRSFYWRKS
jgi:hypothetical protein